MIKNRAFSLPSVIMIARLVVRRCGTYKVVDVAILSGVATPSACWP